MQTWSVSNPIVLLLLPCFLCSCNSQCSWRVVGMFCCFFSPFLTSEVLVGHLLLQFILESCTWIWELSYVSLCVACGFLSGLCVRAQTSVILY